MATTIASQSTWYLKMACCSNTLCFWNLVNQIWLSISHNKWNNTAHCYCSIDVCTPLYTLYTQRISTLSQLCYGFKLYPGANTKWYSIEKNTKKIVVKIFEDTHRPHRTSTRWLSHHHVNQIGFGLYSASESERQLQTRGVSCILFDKP